MSLVPCVCQVGRCRRVTKEALGFNGRVISVSAVCLSRLSSVIKVMGSIRLNEGVELTSIRSFPEVMGNSDWNNAFAW